MGDSKKADENFQEDVDLMIIEYLVHNATSALLAWRADDCQRAREGELQSRLFDDTHFSMVDAFLDIYKARHTTPPDADSQLPFRLALLRLTTLYTRRFDSYPDTPSRLALSDLRSSSSPSTRSLDPPPSAFADAMLSSTFATGLQEQPSQAQSMLVALEVPLFSAPLPTTNPPSPHNNPSPSPPQPKAYGTSTTLPTLADLLPLTINLTQQRRAAANWTPTPAWLYLAADMMRQACLEQWLVLRTPDPALAASVFAWGDDSANADASWPEPWPTVRAQALDELTTLPADVPLLAHLQAVAARHSAGAFEAQMLGFLRALLESVAVPELVGLEEGRVEGLSVEETRVLRERVGFR